MDFVFDEEEDDSPHLAFLRFASLFWEELCNDSYCNCFYELDLDRCKLELPIICLTSITCCLLRLVGVYKLGLYTVAYCICFDADGYKDFIHKSTLNFIFNVL
jgi:hypothetical protein